MGNIFSVSLSCDSIVSRCWDLLTRRAKYVNKLQRNLEALDSSFQELMALKNDVLRRVEVAELQRSVKSLDQVQLWIKSVETVETQVTQLVNHRAQEIQKLCCGGFCSKNYLSSYKYGKKVADMLVKLKSFKNRASFREVGAESIDVEDLAHERPSEATVGMEFMFDKVWRYFKNEDVGVIGLYGMGGVGKTTLLTQIHNNLLKIPHDFNLVIWIVVSKDLKIGTIQDKIGEKIGLSGESWKHKEQDEKAQDIYRVFSKKKFVLFLDDIWEQVEITKLGVPVPNTLNKSKIIFTTRSEDVCFRMEAQPRIKVECLEWEKAWELFEQKVGKDTIHIHPEIEGLAETVARECGGLPLAVITVGRAMACKKTPQQWKHAIQVLQKSASEFSGMKDKVFHLLKFSYDTLPSEKVRSCFLYCALFPEDYLILKEDLLYYWMCEEILDEFSSVDEAKNQSCDIIGTLLTACLLEEGGESVKMHDVIRDMALWLACDCGKENSSILVHTGSQEVTNVENWKNAKRVSLVDSHIECLVETPKSANLLTLLIRSQYTFGGSHLTMISDGFFNHMGSLQVLDLSNNWELTRLPSGVSKLVSLQHLNLSFSGIRELPIGLKDCVRLRYLNLEYTLELEYVPPNLISSFEKLRVLRMAGCGKSGNGIFFGICGEIRERESDSMMVIEGIELEGLEELEFLSLSIHSFSFFQDLVNYPILVTNCIRHLQLSRIKESSRLDISSLLEMNRLEYLFVGNCPYLVELEVFWERGIAAATTANDDPSPWRSQNSMMKGQRTCFRCLQSVNVFGCPTLKDMTWLIFAPNLSYLSVDFCEEMEKIIGLEKLGGVALADVVKEGNPFRKLTKLILADLPKLKSIYESGLPFPYLNKITVIQCPTLKKLPLKFNSPQTQTCNNLVINGEESWWNALEWEDQAASNVFLPCFRPFVTNNRA